MSWCCIQLGSREHYAIPLALHGEGKLDVLCTDIWIPAGGVSLMRLLSPSLSARRNSALPDGLVQSRTLGRLLVDMRMKLQGLDAWKKILHRNEWFQQWAEQIISGLSVKTVFSYSYTARLPFAAAKKHGATCILGQIDPGPREIQIVEEQSVNYRHLALSEENPSDVYWRFWKSEVESADAIVVNSPWSAKLLVEAGVPDAKIVEIPLVYERKEDGERGTGSPPSADTRASGHLSQIRDGNRRLRILFLGSVILRKGAGQLFDAIRALHHEPVDYTFAGPIGMRVPDDISQMRNVRFLGPVDRLTANRLYAESDVFIFPTLSDGFGLTQLEALGHGLPVIASTHCGRVVEDGVNGLILLEITPEAIAEALMSLIRDRELLEKLKSQAAVPDKFHPRHLGPALLALEKRGVVPSNLEAFRK